MSIGLVAMLFVLVGIGLHAGLVGAAGLPTLTTYRRDQKPQFQFLRVTMHGRSKDTGKGNGLTVYRNLQISFDYGPAPGVCNAPANSEGQKISLVQTAGTGFQAQVANLLVANCFARDWINDGIYARWIDVPSDIDIQVGSATLPGIAPGGGGAVAGPGSGGVIPVGAGGTVNYLAPTGDGGVGALGSRLPLDNCVTIHKYTGQRGRSWSGKAWHMSCVPITFFVGDDMSDAGIAAWQLLKVPLYSSITDGISTLYPILVSQRQSQPVVWPTQIAWTPMVQPGTDVVRNITNPIVNYTLGEARRRKEKHGLTF